MLSELTQLKAGRMTPRPVLQPAGISVVCGIPHLVTAAASSAPAVASHMLMFPLDFTLQTDLIQPQTIASPLIVMITASSS